MRASTEETAAKVEAEAAALAALAAGGDSGANSGPIVERSGVVNQRWSRGRGRENMAKIAFAESGDDPSIVQKGQPPGLTGYGLPDHPHQRDQRNGNWEPANADNNTKAAISLFSAAGGYSP